jgi:hypothetical protein
MAQLLQQVAPRRPPGLALDLPQIEQGLSRVGGLDDDPNACLTRSAPARSSSACPTSSPASTHNCSMTRSASTAMYGSTP